MTLGRKVRLKSMIAAISVMLTLIFLSKIIAICFYNIDVLEIYYGFSQGVMMSLLLEFFENLFWKKHGRST